MQLDFLNVLFTVLFLVVLVVPGYVLSKLKLFPESAESVISTLVLYVAQPMLMITSFQSATYSKAIAKNMIFVAFLTAVVHAVMIALMFIFIRGKEDRHNCVRAASVFANCGYMGLPFLKLLFFGQPAYDEILIYGAIVISVFNIFDWSLGIFMMSGDKKNLNIKNSIFNPTVISIFIGLMIFLICKKPLIDVEPSGSTLDLILEKFMKCIGYLAEMVTPLAMMVIGVKLSRVNLKQLLMDKWAYLTAFNKLVLMSLVSILTVAFLPISESVKYAVFFGMSMPSATSNVLFAVKFGGDGERASVTVLLSTILSILTIPLMYQLFANFI